MCWDNGGFSTISSMAGGGTGITWTSKIAKFVDTRHDQAMQMYLGTGYTGTTGAITCTFNNAASYRSIAVWEVTNPHATQFDATGSDVLDAGTVVDCAVTTTQANCFVSGSVFNDSGGNTISLPAGMTSINNFNIGVACATHYRTTNPGAGATTVDWTFSGTGDAVSVACAVAPSADGGGRVSKNTHTWPLGMNLGMHHGLNN
jgi:hypothetical protein